MPDFSRKPIDGLTPVALMTRSTSMLLPLDSLTLSAASPLPFSIASTRVLVNTCTPLDSHQSLIMPPAVGPIMRGTMRSPISTTLSLTPRAASASMMMHPMKPAPICSTLAPLVANLAMARASSMVQQVWMPGKSMPGIGGLAGREPVAISRRSNFRLSPLSSDTVRAAASTLWACAVTSRIFKSSKWVRLLRR